MGEKQSGVTGTFEDVPSEKISANASFKVGMIKASFEGPFREGNKDTLIGSNAPRLNQ